MNIKIDNKEWIDVRTCDYKKFILTAVGDNRNTITIDNISKKYLIQLRNEIGIMLKNK